MNTSIPFSCPKCAKEFKEITNFNKHMEEDHDVFHLSFPNLSLESGSISKLRMIHVGNVVNYLLMNLISRII